MNPDLRNRILYVRDVSTASDESRGAPRGVIVYNVSSSNVDGHIRVTFGAAFCNRGEQFARHRGVEIAKGRMEKKPFVFDVSSELRPFEVERLVMSLLSSADETSPKWSKVGNDAARILKRYVKFLDSNLNRQQVVESN